MRRLETLACGLYWWDPIAWWVRREVERAEENCCDAWVLWALPAAAEVYAEALLTTAVYLSGQCRPLPSGASGAERLRPLKRRLHMILSDTTSVSVTRKAPRLLFWLGALALPLLPAAASTGGRNDVAAARAGSQDQPAKAATIPARSHPEPDLIPAPGRKPDGPPPAAALTRVQVSHPSVREISDFEIFPGEVTAGRQVELRARVSGTLVIATCRPGQAVKEGELLFQIDQRAYRAELDKAQAELLGAQARRTLWSKKVANAQRLVKSKSISQEEVNLLEAEASEADASLKAAEAARDLAGLKFESTHVRAPFDGTVSGPVLTEGNLVVADTTHLATISTTDSVHVTFNVDQQTFVHINRLKRDRKIKGGSMVGLPVTVVLPDEQDLPHNGKIDSVELRIDPSTGTSRWGAVLPNPDGLLLPGMFVSVRLTTSEPHKALVVPGTAVMSGNGREFVFVLTKENIVETRSVKSGYVDDGVQPVEGLKPDEWVVIGYKGRLNTGEKVLPEKVPSPAKVSP